MSERAKKLQRIGDMVAGARIIDAVNCNFEAISQSEKRLREQEERASDAEHEARKQAWLDFCAYRGRRYADCTLDNFRVSCEAQERAVESLRGYLANLNENIALGVNVILLGPPGAGKDHLLTAMCRGVFQIGRRVYWTSGMEIFARVRDCYRDEASERSLLETWTLPDVLYVSDPIPARDALTGSQITTLYRIIDRRYNNLKPTWISINVAKREEADALLSEQVARRLRENALQVFCDWECAGGGKK